MTANINIVKTWRERIGQHPDFPLHAPTDVERAMEAEISDLRAALARAPLPAQGGALTDEQIIAALHANAIDTYPSKYGFDAVQVSATSVPTLRKVIEKLAAPAQAGDARDAARQDCGHGHVYPNASGIKARCGGPGLCAFCASDLAAMSASQGKAQEADTKPLTRCAAGRDGECGHPDCPQLRDNEPQTAGRHCPLDSEGGHHD